MAQKTLTTSYLAQLTNTDSYADTERRRLTSNFNPLNQQKMDWQTLHLSVHFLSDSVNMVKSPENCVNAVCGFLCNFASRIIKQER